MVSNLQKFKRPYRRRKGQVQRSSQIFSFIFCWCYQVLSHFKLWRPYSLAKRVHWSCENRERLPISFVFFTQRTSKRNRGKNAKNCNNWWGKKNCIFLCNLNVYYYFLSQVIFIWLFQKKIIKNSSWNPSKNSYIEKCPLLYGCFCWTINVYIGKSSNGRTADFDSVSPGSNPGFPNLMRGRETVSRRAHNPKIGGPTPSPATKDYAKIRF